MTYKIWITVTNEKRDREHLESLGVKVGTFDADDHDRHPHTTRGRGTFQDCEIDGDDLLKLFPFWARRYVWGAMPGQDSTAHPMLAPKLHPNQHSSDDTTDEGDDGL